VSAYGSSKLRCEKLVQEAVLQRKGMVTIIRPFSIIGLGIRPDLAPAIFADCLIHHNIIEIFGDGSARRDFTHVNDLVDALLHSMNRCFVEKSVKIFPIGRGEPRTVNELLKILTTMIGKKPRVIHAHQTSMSSVDLRRY
jgi:UDP-glucuronate 4-epimerase